MSGGEMIKLVASDGQVLSAYRHLPDERPRAGLVVCQEVFGVNHHVRAVCDQFAARGFATVAPALFDRIEPGIELSYREEDLARGRELRTALGWDGPVKDVDAAIRHVAEHGPVGIIGYCWGGSISWLAATRLKPACAVCYYGGQIYDFKDETPQCPVLMHFGQRDHIISADQALAIRNAQPDVVMWGYPAGHDFNCTERDDYDPDSAKLALERTLAFFDEHLL